MGRVAVARVDVALRDVKLWFIGDVTQHAGLGTGAEQCTLRPLENFDALEIRRVDVQVATRQRYRLVVEIYRDIRDKTNRTEILRPPRTHADGKAEHKNHPVAR